jgi:capsular exopolysaccharide synthesis family protein
MSRIHEALKKAASERNAQLPADSASELVELAGESVAEREIPAPVRDAGRNGSAGSGKAFSPQLEELLRKCQRTEWKIDPRFSVFLNETQDRSGAEKLRTLRSRLYQMATTRPLKRIVVTSSVPGEGKTFIASNLAQSIIQEKHRRVLLVDGDLRASLLHLTLGASAKPGLSDYLSGKADEFEIVQTGAQPNLSLIGGGTQDPNPSELLLSNAMRTLLDRLTPLFDWVILDSPPAIAVHDASILADMCDGVLLVVQAGMTDFEVAKKAAGEFDEKKLLGVVLNRVEKSEGYPYYYAYSAEKEGS